MTYLANLIASKPVASGDDLSAKALLTRAEKLAKGNEMLQVLIADARSVRTRGYQRRWRYRS